MPSKFMSIVETWTGNGAGRRQGPGVESLIGDLGLCSEKCRDPTGGFEAGEGADHI